MDKRRIWTHRLLLESLDYGFNCSFVTLTYKDDLRDLEPYHLQTWLKRFRRKVEPVKIRYFAVGEYGDVSWRPHYHVALYGWPSCIVARGYRECPVNVGISWRSC